MAIAMEKQKQAKKYLAQLVSQKYAEIDNHVELKAEEYSKTRFEEVKAKVQATIDGVQTLLDAINTECMVLADTTGYKIKLYGRYHDYSLAEKIDPIKINEDSIYSSIEEEYKKLMQDKIAAAKHAIKIKEMEITEYILFAGDTEIHNMIKELKSMPVIL